jgi:hypothetical protein
VLDAEVELKPEVEPEAEEVKGKLGMEARLANEGLYVT